MPEELHRLSKEDIAKLDKTMREAKDLTARQEEIIQTIIDGEKDIFDTKIGYLDEYFDAYSKHLDTISEKMSRLEKSYLIIEKLAAKIDSAATSEDNKKDEKRAKVTPRKVSQVAANSSGGENNNSSSSSSNTEDGSVSVSNKLSEQSRKDVTDEDLNIAADRFAKFFKQTEEERRNQIESSNDYLKAIEDRNNERKKERLAEHAKDEENINKRIMDLNILRYNKEEEIENKTTEIRLANIQSALDAEIQAANTYNELSAQLRYSGEHSEEAGEIRERTYAADQDYKSAKEFEDKITAYRAEKEYQARKKANGKLTKEASAEIEKEIAKKFKLDQEALDKLTKEREKREQKQKAQEGRKKAEEDINTAFGKGVSIEDRAKAFKNLTHNEATGEFSAGKAVLAGIVAISNLAKKLENDIDEIAKHKGSIDTRLQGSNNETWAGSYWDQIVHDITRVGAINPYFKQKDFAGKVESLVGQGIAFNVEQRAFLEMISDKIASTFSATDGTLLKLVRIQQEDSTAGRLGMESAINAFLNEMYENTEYLESVANNVRSSLYEMESLMSGAEATEVEFQVQKWLGSLYSVGMSDSAVQGIATSLGQIAAGQIEGLTGSSGNLLIMAANDANLSIADILTDGINSSDTNKLLQAAVNYLAELSDSAKDNKVVQQQLANVFGVRASDLKAATNLTIPGSVSDIYGKSLTYDDMLNRLFTMAGSMASRTSLAEMMSNVWENGSYTIAGSMASNPISYFIYKAATLLDDTAGGIAIPAISTMMGGVDLETTVSDLLRVGAIGTGILGSIGAITQGLGNSFSGRKMLEQVGVKSASNLQITPRGNGTSLVKSVKNSVGAATTSTSGYVGNANGSDIKDSTLQEAEDSKKQHMIEAKEEEGETVIDVINNTVLKIYELLDDVASGKNSLNVRVAGYGLTKGVSNSNNSIGGISGLGGIDSVGGGNSSNSAFDSGVGSAANSSNSFGSFGNRASLGGWTTSI